MKVKFKTLSAGPRGVIRVGDIVDVSDSEAALLVKVGCAEYVENPALRPAVLPEKPQAAEKPQPTVHKSPPASQPRKKRS